MRSFVVEEPASGALRALNYSPTIERIRRAGSNSARPLHEIVKGFGPAYGTVFTRLDCHPDHGIELLSQSDMFAAEPHGRVIRRDSMRECDKHLIERGQVLIAGAGTLGENELYGRAILADHRLAGKYVGPDSMTLVFEDPEDDFSLFAFAWLASPTGVSAIRSTSYGTKILRFRQDLLTTIPVPLASPALIKRVADAVRRARLARERAFERLSFARSVYANSSLMQEATAMCAPRRRATTTWNGPFPSLSAWNFASTGEALPLLRRHCSERVADLVEPDGIFAGFRFVRINCDHPHGIELLSQRDAFMVRPAPRRIVFPSVPRDRLMSSPGTIMLGAQGNIGEGDLFGRAMMVDARHASSAFTQHLLRVRPKAGEAERLFAYLSTDLGFRLTRTTAVGTAQRSVRIDLLREIPVPSISDTDAARIRSAVGESVQASIDGQSAEDEAIRTMEQEVLPQWLA
jgi:type I restriction enzyme S subunit